MIIVGLPGGKNINYAYKDQKRRDRSAVNKYKRHEAKIRGPDIVVTEANVHGRKDHLEGPGKKHLKTRQGNGRERQKWTQAEQDANHIKKYACQETKTGAKKKINNESQLSRSVIKDHGRPWLRGGGTRDEPSNEGARQAKDESDDGRHQKSQRGESSLSAANRKETKAVSAPQIVKRRKQPQRRKSQRGESEPEEAQGQQ
jgi:hypothetical protein